VAGFVNAAAAAAWARARGGDIALVCAGSLGANALEDQVCAGWLATLLADAERSVSLTPGAAEACATALRYGRNLERLARDARHARSLEARGHGADIPVCLAFDTSVVVPVLCRDGDRCGVDKLVWGPQ
jgi:phosphosulfolactate phosphohydrolase-like enzyme